MDGNSSLNFLNKAPLSHGPCHVLNWKIIWILTLKGDILKKHWTISWSLITIGRESWSSSYYWRRLKLRTRIIASKICNHCATLLAFILNHFKYVCIHYHCITWILICLPIGMEVPWTQYTLYLSTLAVFMCLMFCLYDTSLLSVCFHFICQLLPLSSSRSLCLSLHLTSVVGIFASIRLKTLPCEVTPKSFSLHPLTSAIFLALSFGHTLPSTQVYTHPLSLWSRPNDTHVLSFIHQAHSLSLTSYSTQSNHLSNTISLSFFFTLSLSLYYFQSACNKSLFSGEMDDRAAAFC